MEKIIIVDEADNQIDTCEKLEAHRLGLLHRAFSIFIFNSKGEFLMQKRNPNKYHSGGLWSNTCCSHPNDGESIMEAAHRRLKEEIGINADLTEIYTHHYRHQFDNDLVENEIDHVLTGIHEGPFQPDPLETTELKWMTYDELKKLAEKNPHEFTVWYRQLVDIVWEHFMNNHKGKLNIPEEK